jgi:ABC-type amino acid transport substrate-binding protein
MHRRLFFLFCLFVLSTARAQDLRIGLGVQNVAVGSVASEGRAGQPGGLTAFNEDLAREICRRLNAHCKVVHVPFAEILASVEEHRLDLGFGNFLRTAERERRVDFSEAIWRSSSRLLARPGTVARFAADGREPSLDGLRNARLVAVAESQQYAYLRSLPAERRLTVLSVQSMAETLQKLRDGQADFALQPVLSAFAMLDREPPGSFEFVGPPLAANGLGGSVHIALAKGNPSLRQTVNQAIAAMRADGTLIRIVRRYFPFNLD